MALEGIVVLELEGLAPGPYCGMVLGDYGATVIRVHRTTENVHFVDPLQRGKLNVGINLKSDEGREVFLDLVKEADVLIESYRPGVMERLKLGPEELFKVNPRLIYARISGYGQTGPMVRTPGHDINFLAVSGVLSLLGDSPDRPSLAPSIMLSDFTCSIMTAMGICMAVIERERSGRGQVLDANLVESMRYFSTMTFQTRRQRTKLGGFEMWPNMDKLGANLFDGGAPFYCTYRTKDGKELAVGTEEEHFYRNLCKGLGLDSNLYPQTDVQKWPETKELFGQIFATHSLDHWVKVFADLDTCVSPVVDFDKAHETDLCKSRGSFEHGLPVPCPGLDRTPAKMSLVEPFFAEHTQQILQRLGYSEEKISELVTSKAITVSK